MKGDELPLAIQSDWPNPDFSMFQLRYCDTETVHQAKVCSNSGQCPMDTSDFICHCLRCNEKLPTNTEHYLLLSSLGNIIFLQQHVQLQEKLQKWTAKLELVIHHCTSKYRHIVLL